MHLTRTRQAAKSGHPTLPLSRATLQKSVPGVKGHIIVVLTEAADYNPDLRLINLVGGIRAWVTVRTFGPLFIGNFALFGACAPCWIARSVLSAASSA
jgi:hypothetical protein